MSTLVDPGEIETIVGARRHSVKHLGRLITETRTVYVLHSHLCRNTGRDLRECEFSIAMDEGVDWTLFTEQLDRPIIMGVDSRGLLMPANLATELEQSPPWPDHTEPITYLEDNHS